MNIVTGTKKVKKGTLTAIAEFQFNNGYKIHVFQGGISTYDILLKYKSPYSTRIRTPKHIHWVVDLLLKRTQNSVLTTAFIGDVKNFWNTCSYLTNNNFATLQSLIQTAFASVNLTSYAALNAYGEYDVEFIFCLTCLLALQEKTNANAHGTVAVMFGNILTELANPSLDLFKVMSTAGFGGR